MSRQTCERSRSPSAGLAEGDHEQAPAELELAPTALMARDLWRYRVHPGCAATFLAGLQRPASGARVRA